MDKYAFSYLLEISYTYTNKVGDKSSQVLSHRINIFKDVSGFKFTINYCEQNWLTGLSC